jgi:hypothetical protein
MPSFVIPISSRMNKRSSKLIVSCIVLILSLSSCSIVREPDSNLDFSGVDLFWKLADTIQNNTEPSEYLWEELFSTPGYKTFLSREMKPDWMKDYIRMGLMPSHAQKLRKWEDSGYWDVRFAYHFQEVVERKGEIKGFVNLIKRSHLQADAIELMLSYYPENTYFENLPPVSFIFFDKDARGYDPILLDVLYAMDKHKHGELMYLMAHEMHHYYRNQLLTFEYPPEDSSDHDIIWTLDQVHMEGIADQIDKDSMFMKPWNAKRTKKYKDLLIQTPRQIHIMDSLLMAYSSHQGDLHAIAASIHKSAPMSGHPMGYFMAKKILEHRSREALVEDIGNPFAFLQRYQAVALLDEDAPAFSSASMELIAKLETKY